jgi:hypothetical protein
MSLTLPGVCCPPVPANGSRDLAVQRTCHALHLTYGFTIHIPAWLRSRSPSTRPAQSVLSNTRHTGLIRRTGFTGRYLLDDLSPLDPSRWVSTSPGTTRTRPLDMGPPYLAIGTSRLCPPRLTLLPAFGLQSREPAQTAYYLIRCGSRRCFLPVLYS